MSCLCFETTLKNILPCDIIRNIYNTLILPHFNYGLIIWGWQSKKLLTIQKKAVRVIGKTKYNAHTSPIFKKFYVLKLPDLCACSVLN